MQADLLADDFFDLPSPLYCACLQALHKILHAAHSHLPSRLMCCSG